ncbi:Glutathione S-transferase 2 [Operophtera brumata]|uniref:Glutathione S-transferase 2 n=1 Tax=Operophtera brumata TaxID=104452 RepID=A0A0L7KSA9_OPEBR|nr:Glutathione S-transferase 2 [Operophtera brumata]
MFDYLKTMLQMPDLADTTPVFKRIQQSVLSIPKAINSLLVPDRQLIAWYSSLPLQKKGPTYELKIAFTWNRRDSEARRRMTNGGSLFTSSLRHITCGKVDNN